MHSALERLRPDLTGFDATRYPLDLQGWGSDAPIFADLIAWTRPRLIIEVGSWKGASAIHMAGICAAQGLEAQILCVDTWLGAGEFITAAPGDPERDLRRVHGWPTVYYQFLANVVQTGHAGRIVPFPQTSQIAARWLAAQGVRAELIYIDGSHDAADVRQDIEAYVPLLQRGGVLFGDDYDCWPSVRQAVEESGRAFDVTDGRYWVLR